MYTYEQNNELIHFLLTASRQEHMLYQRKTLFLTGDVTIPDYDETIHIAIIMQKQFGLKKIPLNLARRFIYASRLKHQKRGTTIIADIESGKTRCRPKSYKK